MKFHSIFQKAVSRGFTLVEIMVAMVIGLIATVVIFQVFSVSEERNRATTGAGDTQSIGNIALATLKNQIAHAGYGFVSPGNNMSMSILGCSIVLRPSNATLSQLAPVIINPIEISGQDQNTDTLLIAYGTARGAQEGTFLMKAEDIPGEGQAQAAISYVLPSAITFEVNDLVVAAPANIHPGCDSTPLDMNLVTRIIEGTHIVVDTGNNNIGGGTLYNFGTMPGTDDYVSEQVPHVLGYRVRNSALEVCDFMLVDCSADDNFWSTVAPDIVSLRVQYRLLDGTFTQTVPVMPEGVQYGFANILGVRFVIVARSPQLGKTDLTNPPNDPTWSGQETVPEAAPIDLSTDSDWRRYRYTTFESSAAIRNVVWMGRLE